MLPFPTRPPCSAPPPVGVKAKEAILPQMVRQADGTLEGLREVFGLANLGEMPDDIALLVLSRKFA